MIEETFTFRGKIPERVCNAWARSGHVSGERLEALMTDDELDIRLNRMADRLPSAVEAEAGHVARDTMPPRLRRGRAPRAPWVLPVVVAGGLALTAGASTAVVAMSHWAGVSMPAQNIRNTQPIPVTWTTPTGHTEQCRVWIELRHPTTGDAATLDAAITAHDWGWPRTGPLQRSPGWCRRRRPGRGRTGLWRSCFGRSGVRGTDLSRHRLAG